MNFFLSPVVDSDNDFHLLDQGSMDYLYHLQILFFNLEDASPSDNVSSSSMLLLTLRCYNNNVIIACFVHSGIIKDNDSVFNNTVIVIKNGTATRSILETVSTRAIYGITENDNNNYTNDNYDTFLNFDTVSKKFYRSQSQN